MAKKKQPKKPASKKKPTEADQLKQTVAQYESVFGEIDKYIELINGQEEELAEAQTVVDETKHAYEEAKEKFRELRDFRDNTKHGLYRFLAPGVGEIMPLFDKMDVADEKKHGKGAKEWRKDPLVTLRLSVPSLKALEKVDVLFIGQLQDLVQAKPSSWWRDIGVSDPVAAAIADKLIAFLADKGA